MFAFVGLGILEILILSGVVFGTLGLVAAVAIISGQRRKR